MQGYLQRSLAPILRQDVSKFPAVVLLGPRQCGKTTLVKNLGAQAPDFLYKDLERPQDLRQLADPELFLEANHDKFLCFDEIQNLPELFPILRGFIDRHERQTRIVLLGSASPELLRHSAESLAGRVVYRQLSPFLWTEVMREGQAKIQDLWLRGGYPGSYLADSDSDSYEWRQSFLQAIVERDLPRLGFAISPMSLGRFVRMLALQHGQILNLAALGNSLGVSAPTVRHHLEVLEGTYHIRLLPPLQANLGKRLVKTPKVYFRDSGLLHALWETPDFNSVLAHPLFGASWEGFVLEQVQAAFPRARYSFYRTASGVEIDLVMEFKGKRIVIETKATTAPVATKGFWTALVDLEPGESFIVAPVESGYPIRAGVDVVNPGELLARLEGEGAD